MIYNMDGHGVKSRGMCGFRSALPLIVPTIIQKSLQKKSSQFLEKSQAYIAFVQDKPVYEKFQNPDQGQTEKASDDRGNGSDNRIVLRDLALSYGDRALSGLPEPIQSIFS